MGTTTTTTVKAAGTPPATRKLLTVLHDWFPLEGGSHRLAKEALCRMMLPFVGRPPTPPGSYVQVQVAGSGHLLSRSLRLEDYRSRADLLSAVRSLWDDASSPTTGTTKFHCRLHAGYGGPEIQSWPNTSPWPCCPDGHLKPMVVLRTVLVPTIYVYGMLGCPYSRQAKRLLQASCQNSVYINWNRNWNRNWTPGQHPVHDLVLRQTTTVPFVFVDDTFMGAGFTMVQAVVDKHGASKASCND